MKLLTFRWCRKRSRNVVLFRLTSVPCCVRRVLLTGLKVFLCVRRFILLIFMWGLKLGRLSLKFPLFRRRFLILRCRTRFIVAKFLCFSEPKILLVSRISLWFILSKRLKVKSVILKNRFMILTIFKILLIQVEGRILLLFLKAFQSRRKLVILMLRVIWSVKRSMVLLFRQTLRRLRR